MQPALTLDVFMPSLPQDAQIARFLHADATSRLTISPLPQHQPVHLQAQKSPMDLMGLYPFIAVRKT